MKTTEDILRAERDNYAERITAMQAALKCISESKQGARTLQCIASSAIDDDMHLAAQLRQKWAERRERLHGKSFVAALRPGCITDALIGGRE
jgi:phosphoheptose isomerase